MRAHGPFASGHGAVASDRRSDYDRERHPAAARTASPLDRARDPLGTAVVLAGMIASGLQIYEAYARFGGRGGPFLPSPFDGTQFPHWSRLGGWLAGALNWHFALMWPLVAFGLLYLGFLVRSGEWRSLLVPPRDGRR